MYVLALGLLCAIAVAPILAIVALVRLRRLERDGVESRGLALRIRRLEERLLALERGARPAETVPPADEPQPRPAARPGAPPPPAAQETPPSAPPPVTAPRRAASVDLETLIGGRLLLRVGTVALLLAAAFFLKYAFDNQWIGPAGRVSIGLVSGVALVGWSQWLLRRGHVYFSEGIAATGAGVLYLSLYAAWGFYELVPRGAAFAGMALVTAAFAGLAAGRDSERLALLALLGGLVTPELLGQDADPQLALFTYLAVLAAGFLALAGRRDWRWLEPVALVGTVIHFAAWYSVFYAPEQLGRTLAFATLFFAEFAVLSVLGARRVRPLFPEQPLLVVTNALWFMVALHAMLYREHRWSLTAAVLALAAGHLAAALALPRTAAGPPGASRQVYGGLALTLVTVAIPIRLEGEWIPVAWAVEGALLTWNGFRSDQRWLRGAGQVLLALVVGLLFTLDSPVTRPIANSRCATFAVAIAAFAAAALLGHRNRERLSAGEGKIFVAIAVGANVLGVWAASLEAWDLFGRQGLGIEHRLAQQLGLSLVWVVYAMALSVTGVRRASAVLRWQGLTLLGLAGFKVFVFDLSFLERGYRILSFLVLGIVLLAVSFLYQRALFGGRGGRGS